MKQYIDLKDKEKALEEFEPVAKLVNLALKNKGKAIIEIGYMEAYKEKRKNHSFCMNYNRLSIDLCIQFNSGLYFTVGSYNWGTKCNYYTAQKILMDTIDWARIEEMRDSRISQVAGELADYLQDFYSKYIKEREK